MAPHDLETPRTTPLQTTAPERSTMDTERLRDTLARVFVCGVAAGAELAAGTLNECEVREGQQRAVEMALAQLEVSDRPALGAA